MKKILIILSLSMFFGCNTSENTKINGKTSLMQEASTYFKSITTIPYEDLPENYQELNNPVNITSIDLTKMSDKVTLGKMLYYDNRLSKDGNISCNSCHNLDTYGVDNLSTSPGDEKKLAYNIEAMYNKDVKERAQFGLNAFNYYLENFERNLVYNKLEEYLNKNV
jgi:cytochrome c peroxidase